MAVNDFACFTESIAKVQFGDFQFVSASVKRPVERLRTYARLSEVPCLSASYMIFSDIVVALQQSLTCSHLWLILLPSNYTPPSYLSILPL